MSGLMIDFFLGFITCFGAFFRSRYNLGLEILALRQQLGVLKRKTPRASPKKARSSILDSSAAVLAFMEPCPHRC
jgi:hypothetical protein